jgi:hypothetical protein
VVQPGPAPRPGGGLGDVSEPTQVVQPGQPQDQASGGGDATGGESTPLVPLGIQPSAIPYAPPLSAADSLAGAPPQPGFGQPAGGLMSQQPQPFGQQPQQFGQQPPPGFGPPVQPGGFGGPPPGYGPPGALGGAPAAGNTQIFGWIAAGLLVVLGLLASILTLTLWLDLNSATSDAASPDISSYCDGLSGAAAQACLQASANAQSAAASSASIPGAAIFYFLMLIVGGLIAAAGGVMIIIKQKSAHFLAVGGGFLLLLFAIIFGAQYTFQLTRIVIDLVVGIVVLIIGALGFIPRTAPFIGLGGGVPAGPGGFGPPPGGGFPGQLDGFPGQQPGPYGQPGAFGPPGWPNPYGQPGGPNPSIGGFAQPGQQPAQPGGFPGQPGVFGQQPNPYGQPGGPNPSSGGFGQPGQQPGQPPQW